QRELIALPCALRRFLLLFRPKVTAEPIFFLPIPGLIRNRKGRAMKARFEKLYGTHVKAIYLYCLKRIRDEGVAEDLAAEVFVRLYTHIDSVRRGEELKWLCKVANHLCVDYWRKAETERVALEKIQTEAPAAATAQPVDSLDDVLNRCARLNEVHR